MKVNFGTGFAKPSLSLKRIRLSPFQDDDVFRGERNLVPDLPIGDEISEITAIQVDGYLMVVVV